MRIEQLEYFLAIVRYGSVSQAANNLYIGQPTLSSAMSALEKELSTKLFKRTKIGMDLTPMGKELLPLAENIVEDFYTIKRKTTEKVITKNYVHLACSPIGGHGILQQIVSDCKKKYPSVNLHVHETLPADVMKSVIEGKATIGIGCTPESSVSKYREYAKDLHLIFKPIYHDEICLCCRNDHPFAQLEQVSYHKLTEQSLVLFEGFIHQGVFKTNVNYFCFTDLCTFASYEGVKNAIVGNNMVSLLPRLASVDDLYFQQEMLTLVPLTDYDKSHIHYVTYCQEHPLTEVEKEILELVDRYYSQLRLDRYDE